MSEPTKTSERVIFEESIKIPVVSQPGVFAWQVPFSLAVPEELSPGETLAVVIKSEASIVAQLYRRAPTGASGSLVQSPSPSTLVSFEYSADMPGMYDIRLSQAQRYPTADATVRMVVRIPVTEGEGDASGSPQGQQEKA